MTTGRFKKWAVYGRRSAIPEHGERIVASHGLALSVHGAEIIHRLDVALICQRGPDSDCGIKVTADIGVVAAAKFFLLPDLLRISQRGFGLELSLWSRLGRGPV